MSNNPEGIMSEEELKAADALKYLDMSKVENRVLLCLFKKEGVTAREIERIADLRQPDVSMGTSALRKKGLIKSSLTPKDGRGRPYDRFYLAKPKEAIITDIQKKMQKRIETDKQNMNALYDIIGIKT